MVIREFCSRHANVLTGAGVAVIVVGGIVSVEDPSRWWVPLAAAGALALIVVGASRARAVVGAILAGVCVVMFASLAFQVGGALDETGPGAIVWMALVFVVFFGCLSYSYVMWSIRSRWAVSIVALIIGFVVAYTVGVAGAPTWLAGVVGGIVQTAVFWVLYGHTGRARVVWAKSPAVASEKTDLDGWVRHARNGGWKATVVRRAQPRHGTSRMGDSVLVWRDRAYVLYPVRLDAPLSVTGRHADRLGYHGRELSAWALRISTRIPPLWRSKGADMTVVLVDVSRANGHTARLIAIPVADSPRKIPLLIAPAPVALTDKAVARFLDDVDSHLDHVTSPLGDPQRRALSQVGAPATTSHRRTHGR